MVLGTPARKNANKFAFSLAYPYLCKTKLENDVRCIPHTPRSQRPHHRPHVDILPCAGDHPVCPPAAAPAAYPANHRSHPGRHPGGQVWAERAGARQFVRAVRQGGHILHHVPGGTGTKHGQRAALWQAGLALRPAHVLHPLCCRTAGRPHGLGLQLALKPAHQLHPGIAYTGGLPYREPLWPGTPSRGGGQCGSHSLCHLCRPAHTDFCRGQPRPRHQRIHVADICGEVCTLRSHRHHRLSTSGALVPATKVYSSTSSSWHWCS